MPRGLPMVVHQPRASSRRVRTGRRASIDTKECLLDAAERLFAAHGLEAVSLRMINAAAGARNASATHYHFRSRESLLKAVARRRMDKLSNERLELLEKAERTAAGRPDVRAIVEALAVPTFRMLLDDSGGRDYVRFLARAATDPTVRLSELATESFNHVIGTAFAMLRRAVPHVPTAVLRDRMLFGIDIGVLAPLQIDRLAQDDGGTIERDKLEILAARVVDFIAGALSAPISAARLSLAGVPVDAPDGGPVDRFDSGFNTGHNPFNLL